MDTFYGWPGCRNGKDFDFVFDQMFTFNIISECNCNLFGTENMSLTCDDNGQCNCKCDVTGLNCDVCGVGHQGFPHCHGKFEISLPE